MRLLHQFSSVTQSCLTPCDPVDCSTLGLPVHHQLLEFTQTHVHWVGIRIFPNESVLCIRWPKYWSFGFSISPSNEYSGLISLRMDWLDLLAVQGTLKSLLQHHSSKASILQHSTFFMVQLSHPYMTTGKTIALTRWTFVGKVMSLLFNMLSRLVITFLPRSKRLLISWLQSPSAVILKTRKIKSVTVSTVSPSIFHEVMGPDAKYILILPPFYVKQVWNNVLINTYAFLRFVSVSFFSLHDKLLQNFMDNSITIYLTHLSVFWVILLALARFGLFQLRSPMHPW